MPLVVYIDHENNRHEVDVPNGDNLMQGALDNDLPSILGDCGGACACATCHVYVDPEWVDKVGEASEPEQDMLDAAPERKENSRLSCQIFMDDHLEGLVLHLPESQF